MICDYKTKIIFHFFSSLSFKSNNLGLGTNLIYLPLPPLVLLPQALVVSISSVFNFLNTSLTSYVFLALPPNAILDFYLRSSTIFPLFYKINQYINIILTLATSGRVFNSSYHSSVMSMDSSLLLSPSIACLYFRACSIIDFTIYSCKVLAILNIQSLSHYLPFG